LAKAFPVSFECRSSEHFSGVNAVIILSDTRQTAFFGGKPWYRIFSLFEARAARQCDDDFLNKLKERFDRTEKTSRAMSA
jgi:hypothetical protein